MTDEDAMADFFGRYHELLDDYEKELLEKMKIPEELLGKPTNINGVDPRALMGAGKTQMLLERVLDRPIGRDYSEVERTPMSMGAVTKKFECEFCGTDWREIDCEHITYQENERGDSLIFDRTPTFWLSSNKEKDMEPDQVFPAFVEAIAIACHHANKEYCESIGDDSQLSWNGAPEDIRESARDGVRKVLNGEITAPEQSHENWFKFKEADGWVYGEVKDAEKKTHPCMVPFGDLPEEQKQKDIIFFGTVMKAAEALGFVIVEID